MLPVFKNLPHIIIPQAGRIIIVVPVVRKLLSIEAVQASKVGPYPQNSLMVDTEAYNYVVAQAVFVAGLMKILSESVAFPVKIDQSSPIGPNPDIAPFVFHKAVYIVVLQAL